MAPAASMIHSATAAAAGGAASNKRPADSDAELQLDSTTALHHHQQQGQGDEADAARKGQQQQLECPRCRSTNTKFCYYNNYSASQPRHFCRACRRYWTHGGTLRDVPVGGASRRSTDKRRRRVSDEPSSSAASSPQMPAASLADADACLLPEFPSAFPFLSDGSFFFPEFDLGLSGGGVALAPAAAFSSSSSWQSSVVPDFYDGLAPWDDGAATAAAGFAGAWGDIAGLDLSWAPPGN